MRYTASANSFLWYLFIPFLVIFYISFIFWSDRNYSNNPIQEVVNKKQQAVNSLASIDGIILGGSNAQFGISAIYLNTLSNLTWMNLAIPAEGYSDINYFNFISNSLSDVKRLDVSFVVYSSTTFLSKSPRKDTSLNLVGKKKISYKPQRSLASYMKSALGYNKKSEFPIANEYGDFDFSEYDCDTPSSTPLISRNYLNEVDLRIWTPVQLTRISELFPNAKIIITVPNGFNNNKKEPNYDARSNLLKVLKVVLLKHESIGKRSAYLISQKPYPSSDLMCGDYWHPNEDGREWRTNELYQLIRDQL
tara:strand:- start:745 stop:1662 length:918 start_codon:yes stop_codon:yes gene_type:complete